jgi:cupin 2 domain-containing protein
MIVENILNEVQRNPDEEIFKILFENKNVKIEKIISYGQTTPFGEWLIQDWDEWVILLQGKAAIIYEDEKITPLKPGDFIFIEKNTKHRVEWTLLNDYTIWLAVHIF